MDSSPRSTFARFVATRGSATALANARALAADATGAPRLLMVFGAPGVGKTHLLNAIVNDARQRYPGASILMASARELVEELIAALRSERPQEIQRKLEQAAVVAVDDLHVLSNVPRTQLELGRLLKTAVKAGSRVVVSAGCAAAEMAPLVDALRSAPTTRIAELRPPRGHEMRRVLSQLAAADSVTVSPAALAALSSRCRGDVRRGMGALARLRFERSLRPARA